MRIPLIGYSYFRVHSESYSITVNLLLFSSVLTAAEIHFFSPKKALFSIICLSSEGPTNHGGIQ